MPQLAIVENEYKKFPELKKEEVLKLQEWVHKQPHLPNITELETLIFLHSCYNRVEAAKQCIDTYYTVRTHCPEYFGNRNIFTNDMKISLNTNIYVPLPGFTPDGHRVLYCCLMDVNPSKFDFGDSLRLFSFAADLWIMEDGIADGHVLVFDMRGIVFAHLAKLGIIHMKKYLFYLQEGLPVRLKGFHFINTVSFMDKVLALMRPFMKKELMDVLQLHGTLDSFDKFVPRDMLPLECGGKAGPLKELQEKSTKHICDNSEWFLEEEKSRRVSENLRPGKPKSVNDLFGIEGNFKKLELD